MSVARTPPCRRLRLYAILALLALGHFSDPASAAPPAELPARPLRTRDWELAWQAFVGAGEVNDAYTLTQRVVKARPHSRLWLTRLAQAARWSNHPRAALAALCSLALDLHETADLQPAFNLAIGLGKERRAIALLRALIELHLATGTQQQMLSSLYLDVGEPERAIRVLQREFTRHRAPALLWEQAVIYHTLGDPVRELATLQQYRRIFGPGPKVMLAIATRDFLQNRLPSALRALRTAEPRARPSDRDYWQTLSALAWELGHYRVAAHAANVLIGTGHADATLYLRAVYATQYRHPRHAFALAERGWKHTHQRALFLSLLGIAASMHPPTPWLARAFALLGPGQAAALADAPFYWTSLAQLRSGEGRHRAALAAYRHALRESPGDDSLLADYLWLLIDQRDLTSVAPLLHRLARRAGDAPQLWPPLAAVYAALHRPAQALPWLQAQWSARKNDPLWLIGYADTLQQADRPAAAWRLRRRAYDLLARRVTPPPDATQLERRDVALARLAIALSPGDPARRLIERLARYPPQRQARLTVLSGMQSEQAYALARWWRLRAFAHRPAPPWALLAQAMARDDSAAIASLLERQRSRLSRRDQVAAASDLGWNSLGMSLAYHGLERAPYDARLHREFSQLALPGTDSLGAGAVATQTSGLLDEGVKLQASHWLSPRNDLEIRLAGIDQRTVDTAQLRAPPSRSSSAVLTWRHASGFGRFTFDLGAGRDLASWLREGLLWRTRWSDGLRTSLGAFAGAQPLDTAALSVAGLEDRLQAAAGMQMTPRMGVQLQLQAGRLRAQGGGTLGSVQRFSLVADYQLWFSPPDFTLDASLSGAHYSRAARLPAQLQSLVPAQEAPSVDFFVPASFVQACGGGHFNMHFATTFTAQVRPFASADLCANTVSGQGYDLTAGIAMPVSGADHLSLSLNLENNVGTHSGRTAGVMLRYRHYFTPLQ